MGAVFPECLKVMGEATVMDMLSEVIEREGRVLKLMDDIERVDLFAG